MIRDILIRDPFTLIILSLIIVITFVKYNNQQKFNSFSKIFWNNYYLKKYKNEKAVYYLFDYFLQLNFIISLSLFIYISNLIYSDIRITYNFIAIIDVMKVIIVFLILKNIAEIGISWFFNIKSLIKLYLNEKINYNNLIGLVILCFNIMLIYLFNPNIYIIIIMVLTILFLKLVGYSNSFILHLKTINKSWFYFILYLCTLEIIPYIILYNFFLSI